MRIVILEDNALLADAVAHALRDQGFAVDALSDGVDGEDFLVSTGADVAIIDVNLPGQNGFDVVANIRRRGAAFPVMMLTARGETADRVEGLDRGADDYLVKPFEMSELLARVRALGRRRAAAAPTIEAIGPLRYDRNGRRLSGPSGPLALSRREIAVFETLLDRTGRIVSKAMIAEAVYGVGAEIDDNAVELQISRLRRKLKGSGVMIQTARGLGYSLDCESVR